MFSVSGSGSVTYGFWPLAPPTVGRFTVRQALTLGVVAGVARCPQLAGDPEVELHDVAVFEATIRERAREYIRTQLQLALERGPRRIRTALDVGRSARQAAPRAASRLAGCRADRGRDPAGWGRRRRHRGARPDARHRGQAGRANGFSDALESWIPGGTIDRFVWGTVAEQHRFVSEKRTALSPISAAWPSRGRG